MIKTKINPIIVAIVIITDIGAIALSLFSRSESNSIVDTQLPPSIVRKIKARGEQPMPPIPMPGGGPFTGGEAIENGPPAEHHPVK